MNTEQLLKCIRQDSLLRKYCVGVFALDTVPRKIIERPACFIVNTDPVSKPGTHWFAVFLLENSSAPSGLSLAGEYFDSYGRVEVAPAAAVETATKSGLLRPNTVRIQGPLSSACGQYCLYYLCHRVRGREMRDIVNDFSTNYVLNDLCVTEYVNRNFNLNMQTFDFDYIVSQVCKAEQ